MRNSTNTISMQFLRRRSGLQTKNRIKSYEKRYRCTWSVSAMSSTRAAAPVLARKALTNTELSRTIRSMFAAESVDHLGDFFFLLQGRFVAGRLLGMDAGHHLQEFLPGFGAVDHGHRLEE